MGVFSRNYREKRTMIAPQGLEIRVGHLRDYKGKGKVEIRPEKVHLSN